MSEFQINFFENVDELFIDGTFKVAPKNWFQLLNIFGYEKKKEFYMPLAYIALNSKSEEIYNKVFGELVALIKTHTKIKDFDGIKIMCDFELPLRKAIKNNFKNCLLDGCYFHYAKEIWKKIKKLKLFKKKLRYETIIVAFIIKVYPFIKDDKRENYCQQIKLYCDNLGGNYPKLNLYFIKYWKECSIFNFTNTTNEIIINRTNNICETFHSKINRNISHYHPKMSYLVDELKNITKSYYDDYIKNLSILKKEKEPFNYIANDIFKFIKKFVYINKENININTIVQNLNKDGESFYHLIISILENIVDCDYNIIESIKPIFVKNNILKRNDNEAILEDEAEEEEEKDSDDNDDSINKIKKYNNKSNNNSIINNKNKDYIYLFNGDVYYEELRKNKKIKKKKSLIDNNNMLNDLDVKIDE